jgi:peptidoglycan/LPS O-acetylase OafA/YrhL
MQQSHQIFDTILFCDGIAIFFIVLYHELVGKTNYPLNSLCPYLVAMGMTLFTFSSGYKLVINHVNTIDQRIFLSKYYIKRFIRLTKAYLGYTLLMILPVLTVVFVASHFFHIVPPPGTRSFWILFTAQSPGISIFSTIFNTINIFTFLNFLGGENLIAGQLWYLVALLGITSICFTILYFLNIKWLFLSFIPFFLISCLIRIGIIRIPSIVVSSVFLYLPFFIFGGYWAYIRQQYQTVNWLNITRFSSLVFFLFLIISLTFNFPNIWIYFSCFFFPLFLLLLFDYVKKIKLLYPFLIFCGTYSFQIYLFHEPLILPILSISIINILKIDYFFMPLLIAILAIYICVIVYKIVKRVHLNILFE